MAEYYAALRSGDSWTGATLHTDPECVDGNPSPLPEFVAEHDSTEFCPECSDVVETCEVVKADGEVCGRERPCPYHD